ncbi:hypothetical protein MCANUF31_00903 [Mycoplasmopsis canis UF31]|uniref:MYPU_1760 family metalloprotease n=1 Tax=Mycoplasmopsis canis TaxID=29555 RepID=UPI00025AEC6B|nr:hypothetical protein [Mycoplasmopsis canis]EIE40388.1 hypothetical protein MCANUF31_00903 [Mycoplasmopsis canis UF31]
MKFKKIVKSIGLFSLLSITSFASSCSIFNNLFDGISAISGPEIDDPEKDKTPPFVVQPKPPIEQEKLTLNDILPITENELFLTDGLSEEEKKASLEKFNSVIRKDVNQIIEKTRDSDKKVFIEYQDTETGIIFRDFSYHTDENGNKRYLLGRLGLLMLIQEFKRKVPFGFEVRDLKSININDFAVINEKANGLYMPESRRMFINGSTFMEKGFSMYEIIGGMMPTIFHEYMHHWATTYAETGLIEDPKANVSDESARNIEKRSTTEIFYAPSTNQTNSDHAHGSRQFWNSYFASNFYKVLNFDVNKKAYIDKKSLSALGVYDKNKLLYNNLTLNDIWRLSNEFKTPDYLVGNPSPALEMGISPSGSFTVTKPRLKYSFSLTELVPREYTKYAFESYFSINDENQSYENEKHKKPTINWFGTRYFIKNKDGQEVRIFSPSGNAEDWSKTYLNNFDSHRRQYWFQDGVGNNPYDGTPKFNATVFPNSVFDISVFRYESEVKKYTILDRFGNPTPFYRTEVSTKELPQEKTKSRSVEFYKYFLETMGYGKTISQIYYENSFTSEDRKNVSIDRSKVSKIKFSGFIPNEVITNDGSTGKIDGIVLKNESGIYDWSKFEYSNIFNFFGHKNYDEGAKLYGLDSNNKFTVTDEREKQIKNRIYPKDAGYESNYLNYITNKFMEVKGKKVTVHFWRDKNNDNSATEDELVKIDVTLPTQRAVSSARSSNISDFKFKKFLVEKEKNENKIVIKEI